MQRGLVKLFEFPAGAGFPAFLSLTWFEGGGGLIGIGLFTRLAASVTSGEMAVAYFMVHAPKASSLTQTGETSRSFIASYSSTLFSPAQANQP